MTDVARREEPAGRWAEPAGLRQQLHRERKARRYAESMARQLRRDALHDPLTGLANRTLLLERMGAALARAERSRRTSVCCCWTWTGSSGSTTASGMPAATNCCVPSLLGCWD